MRFFPSKKYQEYTLIFLGCLLVSAGYVFFMSPYRIVPGGIYGISIVLHHTIGTPIGLTALCFNVPLTIIGSRIIGPRFCYKTVAGFVITSVLTDLFVYCFGEDPLKIGNDVVLAAIFGGALIGLGVGLIFQAKASSGGSDVIAMIVSKYTRIPLASSVMLVDSMIVMIGLIAFGDWRIPLYSWITIFVLGKCVTVVLEGVSDDKAVFIVSDKVQPLRDRITGDMGRGGTLFSGKGLFRQNDRQVIMTVVTQRELPVLKDHIVDADPHAFVTVVDAYEILGKGFRALSEEGFQET